MTIRRIILMIGALLSGVSCFVPLYLFQINHQTIDDGIITIMSEPIFGIVILGADLVVIGSAIVGLKKGYVISTLISVGVTASALWRLMISREATAAILGMSSKILGGSTGKVAIEDGPAMILFILAIVIMIFSMIWCAFAEES